MKHTLLYIPFALLLLLCSCSKEDDEKETLPARTVIACLAADNDLWEDALRSIEEMKAAFTEGGAKLIVFADIAGEAPCILEISSNTATTVKVYPDECNPADASQMREILEDITAMYPAGSYGLILWSHASSWLPAGAQLRSKREGANARKHEGRDEAAASRHSTAGTALRSFGSDNGVQMNIPELAEALPVRFDYILFDACLMGSVEVAYELRQKTNFIVASSAPTLFTGFPYQAVLPELLSPRPDLKKVAEGYFNYYQEIMTGVYQSATISVIDTRELEGLAFATRRVMETQPFDKAAFDRTSVQRLDSYEEQYVFDFMDFINKSFPEANKSELTGQLTKTVLYKAHTEKFMNQYEIKAFCGLSCYIPLESRDDLNAYYQQLGWCRAAGFDRLFY